MSFVSKCSLGLSSASTCFLFESNDSLMVFKFTGYHDLMLWSKVRSEKYNRIFLFYLFIWQSKLCREWRVHRKGNPYGIQDRRCWYHLSDWQNVCEHAVSAKVWGNTLLVAMQTSIMGRLGAIYQNYKFTCSDQAMPHLRLYTADTPVYKGGKCAKGRIHCSHCLQ